MAVAEEMPVTGMGAADARSVREFPSCPDLLEPQHFTVPSDSRAQV
jgi:hypothetical protein